MNDHTLDTARLVLCTCPDVATAEQLSEQIVTERLAACVNLLSGVRSIYLWDGALQRDNEVLLLIKTTAARFDALKQWIAHHHPYTTPELIAVPIVAGLQDYLDWVHGATETI